MKSVPELVVEDKPSSPTVLRLRALAHAVRARHSLGIQRPAQRKYLLQASEAGTFETDVGVDLLMAGIQTKLKEDAATSSLTKSKFSSSHRNDSSFDLGSGKSKVRFTKEETSSADSASAGRNTPASSPVGKPPLRSSMKSATMKRASLTKTPLQRVNTIRGDLTALLTPYEAKPRDTEVALDATQNLSARLTCAHSLYKLSCQIGSELAIIRGGAIAQIADFSDVEDTKLLRYSAAVLANVTTDVAVLEDFASKDGVSALLELSWTPLLDVKVACSTALCRLSQSRARAAVLVRSRAITELMSMLTVPHVLLQQLVVNCIVNLAFYGHVFPDRVFLGDPHAVQSPLGLMNVISQLSTAPATSHFAIEALFNLSLYRSSCLGALRGGGAEILYTVVSQLCKLVDGNGGGSSSRFFLNLGGHAPSWTADMGICMKLLRLAADTLSNFSAFVEYHSMMGSHGMKALSLMLSGALRDVGTHNASVTAEERFRCTSVSCSRALTNFSSNVELRRQNFPQDLIHLATKLALIDHLGYAGNPRDARTLMRNAVRALSNLSFEASCRSSFMEIPQILMMLHAVTVLPAISNDETEVDFRQAAEQQQEDQDVQDAGRMPSMSEASEQSVHDLTRGLVGAIELGRLAAPPPIWYLRSSRSLYASSFPWTTEMSEDAKEDALVALLNLAQQATYANDLLRTLDGKLLAAAAEDVGHSRRLRYIYASVLSNLLFDSCLQQLVYGDQVVRALVSGFNFFATTSVNDYHGKGDPGTSSLTVGGLPACTNSEEAEFQALNLAFDDDQERFLASIYLIASELMDMTNVELVVALVLPCMRTYMNLATVIPSNAALSHPQRLQLQRQLPITCYASASLFALTRAATQRRDSQKHVTYSEEAEAMLIAMCGLPSGPGGSGAAASSSSKSGVTQAFCAATLYHLCASTSANQGVIQGLINCCNANEESQSLLACSAAFAIISFTTEGCQQLVQCANLARALNRLGRTSQVECQQYAAIAACNVSAAACVWSSAELKDFIVVALLRANSIQAKQIHAKTLSNLLSHGATRSKVVEDGVLYALMKLSQVMMSGTSAASGAEERRLSIESASMSSLPISSFPSSSADEVFSIGLRALFNLSCDRQYHHKLLSNGVMAYLSAAVECKQPGGSATTSSSIGRPSQADPAMTTLLFRAGQQRQQPVQLQCPANHLSAESRRFALAIICNLASYEENHKELMRAQVMDIIRNYVDADTESRASAAMSLRNLSCRQPWVEMLCERKTLQLLIVCTECEHPVVRQFAVEALANCSLVTDSLHLFGEMRVPKAVLTLLEATANGLPSTSPVSVSWELSNDHESQAFVRADPEPTVTSTYMAALKCLHNIAHDDALALALMEENLLLRLLPLLEYRALGADASACELAACLTHTLAGKPRCAEALLRQRAVSLCALLHRRHASSSIIARECVRILMLLSTYQPIQLQLCETQAVHVVVSICGGGSPMVSARNLRLRECGAATIRNLTLSVTEHLSLFYDKHDDGDGSLQDVGSSSTDRPLDSLHDLQLDDDNDDGSAYDAESPVSLMLERHMLHGIKYFQDEIVSGQASDRILLEASAAIANLSTVKVFRVAMVRLGVIQTLLQLMTQPNSKAQRMSLSSPALTAASTSPVRLRPTYRNTLLGRVCAATLHRLVVEEGATVDSRGQLVPSLLSVLRQTDEELQQVRYECEKISIFAASTIDDAPVGVTPPSSHGARRFTHVQTYTSLLSRSAEVSQHAANNSLTNAAPLSEEVETVSPDGRRVFGSCSAVLPQSIAAAVTQCVRQTYREQKWMVYVLKTILSSQSMIPQLEKKQMRVLGAPKLCFQDLMPSTVATPAANGCSSSRSTNSGPHDISAEASHGGGYLLPVSMEKLVIRRVNGVEEIVPMSATAASSPRPKSASPVTSRPIVSGIGGATATATATARSSSASLNRSPTAERDSSAIDPQGHVRKFNRQMRLLRRNDRRDISSLPPV
ncbi:hypothetical protein PRNP1_000968 [Phytophthora ramorum]